jgi:hypothetical protein
MKLFLSFVLVFFNFFIDGTAQSRWQIGGYLLPGISRQHTLENEDKFPLWEYSRSRFSYGAGFSLYRKLGRSSWLQTGAGLALRQFFSYSELSQQDSSRNRRVLDTLRTANSYSDLEIPLLLQFRPGKAKLKWLITTGLVLGFSAYQSQEVSGYKGTYPTHKFRPNFSSMNHISFWLSTGWLYPITSRFSLLLEPSYQLNFSDLVKPSAFFYDKPHRMLGLRSTVLYNLR